MSLEAIQKALADSQTRVEQLFKEQQEAIKSTGEVSAQLQKDIQAAQDEMKTIGTRLFDLEQSKGMTPSSCVEKSFAETVSEKAISGWNGSKSRVDVGTFNKGLTTADSSAGHLITPHRLGGIQAPGLRRLTIRDLLAQGRTGSDTIEYVRENVFTNNAAPVAEGALKPESDITFTKETANVKTVAHWIQASRQVMSDASMLQSYVGNRLLYGLALKEEEQLLSGDGTGDNLTGINAVASAYDATLNAAGDNNIDLLAHAIYQVSDSEFSASGLIINPRDWHTLSLMKDKDGNYILGGPQAFASNILWGLPVVPTKAQAQGTFTVGAFDLASQIWDRWDASIEFSREDRDNFVKNMLTILCEERLALAHYRPTALVKGEFVTAGGASKSTK